MLFNSIAFSLFLPVVFLLYWFAAGKSIKLQNILLLTSSWFFYGWWDWRFLFLLIFLSLFNYFTGIKIGDSVSGTNRRNWLMTGLFVNLGFLAAFKYYNFFISGFTDLVSLFGYIIPASSTKIILPLGLSFYVFISLSYLLDIKKGTLKPNRNIVDVLLSFSFFPIILAGPIQRPSSLLPQISSKREFNSGLATDGLRQILWGLFTKVVIADNLSVFADDIFLNYHTYTGSTLLLGAIFYSIQIYADFSGYSNMAIGIAKLFGFSLMRNFAYPYFSRDITEFWKRWHISLTTWFRDYLFLPLSFLISNKIKNKKVLNIKSDLFIYIIASLVAWIFTGLWHGANYTFLLWGLIHGIFLIIYQWQKNPRKKLLKKIGVSNDNSLVVVTETIVTMFFVLIAWVFFRSIDVSHALQYLKGMFSGSLLAIPRFNNRMICLEISFITIIFFAIEWMGRQGEYGISSIGVKFPRLARWMVYYILSIVIFFFAGLGQKFIYFQF